ncbi:MAG: hypothetical protein IJC99_05410 [Clostridia bacterium]|nr:hypothetical protein [Clostridia bacterium]
MTKDAIRAIKQAEEQAEVLCRVAEEKAAEMRAQIEREGTAHCDKATEEAKAEYDSELALVRARTQRLVAKKKKEAEAEAEALTATAQEHMEEAVKLIVWGIVERCQ